MWIGFNHKYSPVGQFVCGTYHDDIEGSLFQEFLSYSVRQVYWFIHTQSTDGVREQAALILELLLEYPDESAFDEFLTHRMKWSWGFTDINGVDSVAVQRIWFRQEADRLDFLVDRIEAHQARKNSVDLAPLPKSLAALFGRFRDYRTEFSYQFLMIDFVVEAAIRGGLSRLDLEHLVEEARALSERFHQDGELEAELTRLIGGELSWVDYKESKLFLPNRKWLHGTGTRDGLIQDLNFIACNFE
jgi:hypothetical protein